VKHISPTGEKEVISVREHTENMPVAIEMPGLKVLSPGVWGGMVVEYFECTERIDLRPMLEGLPDDKCPCPHWGYMLKGALHLHYTDGTEEVIKAGDMCYLPAGHTGWFEAGSSMVYFSPEAEQKVVAEHLSKKMQG
jgi:hypothetical protein